MTEKEVIATQNRKPIITEMVLGLSILLVSCFLFALKSTGYTKILAILGIVVGGLSEIAFVVLLIVSKNIIEMDGNVLIVRFGVRKKTFEVSALKKAKKDKRTGKGGIILVFEQNGTNKKYSVAVSDERTVLIKLNKIIEENE